MKVAVMQPYIFPYIGYWQLFDAADCFVILDDVNYITRGYINRNSILINGEAHRFSIPIERASQNKLIKDTRLKFDDAGKSQFIRMIENSYKKAPYFITAYELISRIIRNSDNDLVGYIEYSLQEITDYIGLDCSIMRSSNIDKDKELKGQDRILAVAKALNADTYINTCGGRALYDRVRFEKEAINLRFLDTSWEDIRYTQFNDEFVSGLSIIDVLMFNSNIDVKRMMGCYELNE